MSKTPKPAADATRLDAFVVEEFEVNGEKRSTWNKIGTAWPQKGGFRLVLKAIPVDGVVILHKPQDKQD